MLRQRLSSWSLILALLTICVVKGAASTIRDEAGANAWRDTRNGLPESEAVFRRPTSDWSPNHKVEDFGAVIGDTNGVLQAQTPLRTEPFIGNTGAVKTAYDLTQLLEDTHSALTTMQTRFFSLSLGDWPGAIDWTGAVMSTYISATLSALTRTAEYSVHQFSSLAHQPVSGSARTADESAMMHSNRTPQVLEDTINKYFSQVTSYYFGQNAVSLRTQAFDDILWVVLGWLESVELMDEHNKLHHQPTIPNHSSSPVSTKDSVERAEDEQTAWFATQYASPHAHRAHVFHALASNGWNDSLCGGGLTWNPRLAPYKNTITNTLFISASVGMYLHHPGDDDRSPFSVRSTMASPKHLRPIPRYHDPFLASAIRAYDWLQAVNLTNSAGLYVDGYHISPYARLHPELGPAQCDVRNEMVYTYNQGVVLSGLRGLWEATGNITYLEHGHALVANVMRETGWTATPPSPSFPNLQPASNTRGQLGHNGILTEFCDPHSTCSQDSQTFKGIFMHHLTLFCQPLPLFPQMPGKTHAATEDQAFMHGNSCRGGYAGWVARNMEMARGTRDGEGVFGGWWGAALESETSDLGTSLPEGAADYRNDAEVLKFPPWTLDPSTPRSSPRRIKDLTTTDTDASIAAKVDSDDDPNDRGPGRTVETQGGGLMLLRCAWELLVGYRYDVHD